MPDRIADRRGEAHLWLVLEEALAAARGRAEREVREARRAFRSIADALIVVGSIEPARAEAIVIEFDDVLAVRGMLSPMSFRGREFPSWSGDRQPVQRRADGWLETEIEHHIDLVVDLDPLANPDLGERVVAVLTPAVRALQATGALPHGHARLADVAATFRAAGFHVEGAGGEPDKGWLGFLRDRPAPLTGGHEAVVSKDIDVRIGTVRDQPVVAKRLAWSESVLEVEVEVPDVPDTSLVYAPWRCSVFDSAGRLHLGQPGVPVAEDPHRLVFRLRPGLMAGVSSMWVRITRGPQRLEEQVFL